MVELLVFYLKFRMSIRTILQYPDPRLKIPATPVKSVDSLVRSVVDDMFETHYAQENCAALACSQLDWGQTEENPALRITVIDFSENKDSPLCLINPVITKASGETYQDEGCMSVARVSAKVKRAQYITVEYLDEQGRPQTKDADGFMSKCIQHEIDHLDGLVFLDRLSRVKQMLLRKKFKKSL